MTLEDRHSPIMGGRKDDVTRTPKQNRKRPLSAVLEEFEAEDWDLLQNLNKNNNTEGDAESKDEKNPDKTVSHGSGLPEGCTDADAKEKCHTKTQPCPSSSSCAGESVSSLRTFFETGTKVPTTGRDTSASPKIPRKTTPKFGRRQVHSPSLSPKIPRRYSSSSDVTDSDDDTPSSSDMTRLRQMTDRLRLSTRRASVLQWREQYMECPEFPALLNSGSDDVSGENGDEGGRWTEERTERINTALDWIKNELVEMRTQDQQLARQLLSIRSDLHRLKLARSCEEHQDMLDDVQSELEELQEFADVLDLPTPSIADTSLKHLGVTRMNLNARRFSTC